MTNEEIRERARQVAKDIAAAAHRGWGSSRGSYVVEEKRVEIIAAAITEAADAAEKPWRELLWLNHAQYIPGVHVSYGDDGEMQCCGIDFKRTSAVDVAQQLESRCSGAKKEPS